MNRPPPFLKRYFWDVRFDRLDPKRSSRLVIERVLEYGDPRAVRWMQTSYDARLIRRVLKRSRGLTSRSANFWSKMYRVDRRQVRCLTSGFRNRRAQHWIA